MRVEATCASYARVGVGVGVGVVVVVEEEKRGGKWKVYVSQYALLHCISMLEKKREKRTRLSSSLSI
jgi:hypothetical protein